jgi:unsaturated chondroitin disaccharide hydrolase
VAATVDDLIARIDDTLGQAAGRFPLVADPDTGEWAWSGDGGWCGGFWPGLLWLTAARTGDSRYAQAATEAAHRLAPRATAPTVLRGLLFWYGAAPGDAELTDLAVDAGRSLAKDYDPVAELVPSGEEDEALYDWPSPGACVDGVPGTVPLLALAGATDLAVAHARSHARLCVRDDGSVAQTAWYDAAGRLQSQRAINGSSPLATWGRAQAWAMLGLTQAAHLEPELRTHATRVADWYLAHVPDDHVAFWDFDDPAIPDAPKDTSATAIAAAALTQLGGEYRTAAEATVAALLTGHVTADGRLVDGCYNRRKGLAPRHELLWGTYFLLEAALRLGGHLED